jgi:hypothetical protein
MATTTTKTTMVTFPKCTVEILPEQEVINNIITATEAGTMVDNLTNNWFGQLIVYGRQAVVKAGKAITSYDEAAKTVATVVDIFKRKVMTEFDARTVEIEKGTLVGEDKVEALNRITYNRAKVDNSLKSGKSVIVNSLKYGEDILRAVDDGGHILFRKDGTTRGKTELQNLLKKAKTSAAAPKTDLERALDAAATLSRRMVPLNDTERKLVLDTMMSKLTEMDADSDEIEVEDHEVEPVAKAA